MTTFEIIPHHWTEDFLDEILCGDCHRTFYWSLNTNRSVDGENVRSADGWQRGQLPKYCPLCGALAHPQPKREVGLVEEFPGLVSPELRSIVRGIECSERGDL